MKKFLFSILLLGMISFGVVIQADEIPDNTGTVIVEETETQETTNSTSDTSELASDISDTANEVGSANNGFLDALDEMFIDMGNADDGQVAAKTSGALSRVYGPIIQFARVFIIIALLVLTVPDAIAMAIPMTAKLFERIQFGGKNNSSGGTMGGGSSNGQGQGLLSPDYYRAVASAGSGGVSGGEMGSSGSQGKNVFSAYISLRMKTIIFAIVTIILLMTPVGFALLKLIIAIILKLLVGILNSLGGLL